MSAMDLPNFLLARFAEDAAVALESQQATRDEARRAGQPDPDLGALQSDLELDDEHGFVGIDASRVLAECEAKRRIVEEHPLVPSETRDNVVGCGNCGWDNFSWGPEMVVNGPCSTLRALALPYADHPDYAEATQ